MKRRDFLRSGAAFAASPALAEDVPIAAIAEYESASGGHIGLYAENIATGAKLGWRAHERFVMCSTFKASLAACVLSHVDHGREDLDRAVPFSASDIQGWAPVAKANVEKGALSVREMCAGAVEDSDNTCANILLARIGGPTALTKFWREFGDGETRLDDSEPKLNFTPAGGVRNTTTPAAMANILRHIVLGQVLSEPSRKAMTEWLINCRTGSNRLRAGLPAAWRIGDKTGNNGKDAAGDIAVAWPRPDVPVVMCVYTRGGTPTPAHLNAAFAGIGRAVGEKLAA